MLLKNACILTCADRDYENGYIIIEESKIKEVGTMEDLSCDESFFNVYDLKGLTVCPGFVDAHSHIGILEESIGFQGSDLNEKSDPVTPHLRAIDGINHFDRCFDEVLKAGVTTVFVGPGSANTIGGTFCAMKTHGQSVDEMVFKNDAAMKFAFGENPKNIYGSKNQAPVTRMNIAALIREALFKAKEYDEAYLEFEKGFSDKRVAFDMKMEALRPVIRGEMIVKAHAHRADDILTAIRIAKEFNLKMTIEHCTEGYKILESIENNILGVTVGPILSGRSKPELSGKDMKNAADLLKRGIKVAVIADHPETPGEYLPLYAAMVANDGIKKEDALKMITINAAEICDINDRVGSIETGKDADLAVFTAHPLNFDTKTELVLINGHICFDNRL